MNYYQARQLAKDGKPSGIWHYTVQNDNQIWPVGYCAENCPGHATAEAAQEHYRQWQLDTARYDFRLHTTQEPCRICGEWTQGFASVQPGMTDVFVLCDVHRNRAGLDTLLEPTEWMTSSW